jgi:hypothetical protein
MRARIAVFLVLASVGLRPGATAAGGFDVLGTPLGHGVDLVRQPAAQGAPGLLLRAAVIEPFTEAAIREQLASLSWVGSTAALAVQGAWQRSRVHRRQSWSLAVQQRVAGGRLGLTTEVSRWEFGNVSVRPRWHLRVAWGRSLPADSQVSLQCMPPVDSTRPRVTVQASSGCFSPLRLFFQEERVAGLPVRRRWGMTWGDDVLVLRFGFDLHTTTTSIGVSLTLPEWMWDASVSAHPLLGWSRMSGIAWSP